MKAKSKGLPKAPRHLRAATRRWWEQITREFEVEEHNLRRLTAAAEAWDRYQQAREVLAKEGLTFIDKHGQPRARPEVAIERDARIAFLRAMRELGLDAGAAPDPRLPRLARGG